MRLRTVRPAPRAAASAAAAVLALALLLCTGCAAGTSRAGARPSGRSGAAAPPAPQGAATAPVTAPGYSPREPVIGSSFADPSVIKAGDAYYAYGTNDAGANMPVASAPDVTGPWKRRASDGLVRLPSWATSGRTWAPEVVPPGAGNGSYVLYFTARHKEKDKQCVGVATASSPAGPFVALEGDPLVCPLDLGGAIDPSSFVDRDGGRYLLYKTDARKTAAIWLVRLSPDGLYLAGPPRKIMARGKDDPVLVESPALVFRGGKYVLLYSAGWYFETNYQTRYAVSASLNGPYEKAKEPLQSTGRYDDDVKGPGGASIVTDASGDHLVFHGLLDYRSSKHIRRGMYVAALAWNGPQPVLQGVPTRYEAEQGRLNGCVSALPRPNASGGRVAGPFDRDGCGLDVPVLAPAAGRYSVKVAYANRSGNESHLRFSVNGTPETTLTLRRTQGSDWTSTEVQVDLNAGWNTLGLARGDGQGQIDYLEVR
ncbi:family 43 glycosylhydrolase [Spirillospora sp. NPDC000708]